MTSDQDRSPTAGGTPEAHRDELPADLDVSGYVGPYQFPDNSRRRIPGYLYLVIAAVCVGVWVARPRLVADRQRRAGCGPPAC